MSKRNANYATPQTKITVEKTEEMPKTTVKTTVEEKQQEPIKAVVANCKKVRLRKQPDASGNNVIDELVEGTEVIVLDASNHKWTRVELKGVRGWIMSEYLRLI